MGMYTAYRFHLKLKAETPPEVIDQLKRMHDVEADRTTTIQHPYFLTYRWEYIFTMVGGGFVFEMGDGTTEEGYNSFEQDPETGNWLLKAGAQTKGSVDDAALLLDWLREWLLTDENTVIAAARFEEDSCYNDNSSYGGFENDDPDEINGAYHTQFLLADGRVMQRQVGGCVTEIQLPFNVELLAKFSPVEYWFDEEEKAKMQQWSTEALSKCTHLFTNPIIPHDDNVRVMVNAMRGRSGIDFSSIQDFAFSLTETRPDPLVFGTHAWLPDLRPYAAAFRGKYIHHHKGKALRRGLPRHK